MPPPLARTAAEAHLFMDLRPCRCGESAFDRRSAVVEVEGDLATHYSGACARCGAAREFLFRLPEEIPPPVAGAVRRFGGDAPSELLDAGEWLAVADDHAGRDDAATAAAAMDEVLKFLPVGADTVPDAALWSDRGRAVHAAEPGRFRRARLEAVRDTYRALAGDGDGEPDQR
jgi:hypothetical protein